MAGVELTLCEKISDYNGKIGTKPNDGLCITGSWNNYHNAQVLDSYRVGSDLIGYNSLTLDNPGVNCNPTSNQIGTEPNDGLGITGYQTNYRNAQVLDSYRVGSELLKLKMELISPNL